MSQTASVCRNSLKALTAATSWALVSWAAGITLTRASRSAVSTMLTPSPFTFSFQTIPASPSPLASAVAIWGAVVVVVMTPAFMSESHSPASVSAFLAILPMGVDSGSPTSMRWALARSAMPLMFAGLEAGTASTGMCLTKSSLEATEPSTGLSSSFDPAMKKSPSFVVVICVWICAALA